MTRCTVCRSPYREEIEASLDLGWSGRETAARFGVSASSLSRHRLNHHTRLRETQRELAETRQRLDLVQHASALQTVFSRAGCTTGEEIGELVGRISAALVAAEDYGTLAMFMRAMRCEESVIWGAVEGAARAAGDDPSRIWEEIYAPAGLEEM